MMAPTSFITLLALAAVTVSGSALPREEGKSSVDFVANGTKFGSCVEIPTDVLAANGPNAGCQSFDGTTCSLPDDTCPPAEKTCKKLGGYYQYMSSRCRRAFDGAVGLRMGDRQWTSCVNVTSLDNVRNAKDHGCVKLEISDVGAACWVANSECATYKKACDSFGGDFLGGRCTPWGSA
ncbi:hypothetical protein HGRIS_003189 [Hohenbuehelia grisea]|uniref:Uncharacterized protein n=1 Tax=Hohenbuehelia grisea TaxID=104357 RepID=A0ABR3JMQ1_9AGAR